MFHFLLDSDKDNNTNEADPWIPVASCTLSKAAPTKAALTKAVLAWAVHRQACQAGSSLGWCTWMPHPSAPCS